MAYYYSEPSRTFSEYLLVPGYTSEDCIPDHVSLRTPLVKYRKGQEECPISLNIPMVSAIMQSMSNDTLADVLALKEKNGFSTVAITEDAQPNGKLLGIVTSRDYRISRMSTDTQVR